MNDKHGALGMILWAAVLVMPGCEGSDDTQPSAGSTSAAGMDTSGTEGESMDSTGRPVPIPPDTDGDTDGPMPPGDSSGEPIELSCDAYCELYLDSCQDFSEYANMQHCMDHCAQWPVGDPTDVGGDSLGCRTYHGTVAASTDPELHCPHAGPSGDFVCRAVEAPTCDLYCTRYFNNCGGDLNLWADMDECLDTCAEWYPGEDTSSSGHSTGCRAYYANLAAADPDTHCLNAGPGGGDACVLGR